MTAPKIKWEVSVGAIIQIVLLVIGLAIGYGEFASKFGSLETTVVDTRHQTTRIEHYLSGEDKEYWHKVAENGDADEK